MNREKRMQATERVIKRRSRVVKQWKIPTSDLAKQPHRLHKYNLACGCNGCRAGDPDKMKYKRKKAEVL